jgi:uncharacterized peroxidase-related enzyme
MTTQRIPSVNPAQATGSNRQIFDAFQKGLGVVPNLARVLAQSPAALDGYAKFNAALSAGVLEPKVREQVAIAVAEANFCAYCLSAHTVLGAKAGLTAKELAEARRATAVADETSAILKLARSIVLNRGEVSDSDLRAARDAGVTDPEIVETVALVALNIFTNYLNLVAGTAVDFPVVTPGDAEPAPAASAACACAA